ncbi:MAG TPA: RnfH family protein [Burkholderiales bacterium]|nr:RnfH family protein [Burkholderiales bacterium]
MASRAGNESETRIRVEVAYALRDRQVLLTRELEEGCTVEQAIRRSGILEAFPEIDVARARVGIFGREVSLDAQLRDGDRVEIYRPLIADPKDARRQRARRAPVRLRR